MPCTAFFVISHVRTSKKGEKALISPAVTGTSRTHQTGLPSRSQRRHPTPKPAGTTDAPFLPSRCWARPVPAVIRSEQARRLSLSAPGMGLHPNDTRPDASPPAHARGDRGAPPCPADTSLKKTALLEVPSPSAWTHPVASDADDRHRSLPLPVSALLLTDGPQ